MNRRRCDTSVEADCGASSRSLALNNPKGLWSILGFLFASVALCLLLFWPCATDRKLFSPLDIPPNLFSKFTYMDPAANGVPANHYVIDMILGDLPRNWLVYQSWERGEMPWWDPYTDGGKPLPAEANAINISDPFKVLLFHLLPFELAYNWVRIITFIVSGLGAFCLLQRFRFSFAAAFWGGLLYQFAGCNAMVFSGPTVQACFSYFPWLWLLWDKGVADGRFFWFALSTVVSALIFLSGNLQSHSYVFCFAIAFLAGYGWKQIARLWFLISGIALSLFLGLCLASPFVLSEVELFFLSIRRLSGVPNPLSMFTGVLSVSTFFPWLLGTFRTLDLSKVVYQYGIGFWTYVGSAALVIALLGAAMCKTTGTLGADRKRTAIGLVVVYLIICSTPLLRWLYTRTAGLAVLGLVVLFAFGWEQLKELSTPAKRWGWAVVILALLAGAAANIGAGLIYPRLEAKIEPYVLKKQSEIASLDVATSLRKFQVANFPNEVTFKNREPLVAFLGLMVLGAFLIRMPTAGRQIWLWSILILSSLPLLWFDHRYIPQQPIELWNKFREGGPEQQRVVQVVKADGLRLREVAPGQHEFVFPGAIAQLFGVHTLVSHTSLTLANANLATNTSGAFDPAYADVTYFSPTRGLARGEMEIRRDGPPSRYHWAQPSTRSVKIVGETLDTVTLEIGPGPAGDLIRTDTYYPGWRVAPRTPGVTLIPDPPFSARITVPASVRRLELVYEPYWWVPGLWIAATASVAFLLWLAVSTRSLHAGPPTLSMHEHDAGS